ncbi:MAG: transposase [Acidimicrobiia bacterium]|nr:transposase [Acidimicrobiia bacterium]
MAGPALVDPLESSNEHLAQADPDLVRSILAAFAEQLMAADASVACKAGHGERSPARVNSRNGYRVRDRDTRVGTIDLGTPTLRDGRYFPQWLLELHRPRRSHRFDLCGDPRRYRRPQPAARRSPSQRSARTGSDDPGLQAVHLVVAGAHLSLPRLLRDGDGQHRKQVR